VVVKWAVEMADEFEPEFQALPEDVGLRYWRFRLFYNSLGRSWVGLVLIR
jgi:hypothetical protein